MVIGKESQNALGYASSGGGGGGSGGGGGGSSVMSAVKLVSISEIRLPITRTAMPVYNNVVIIILAYWFKLFVMVELPMLKAPP